MPYPFRTPYWERDPLTWKGPGIHLWLKRERNKCLRLQKHRESEEGDMCIYADTAEGQKI